MLTKTILWLFAVLLHVGGYTGDPLECGNLSLYGNDHSEGERVIFTLKPNDDSKHLLKIRRWRHRNTTIYDSSQPKPQRYSENEQDASGSPQYVLIIENSTSANSGEYQVSCQQTENSLIYYTNIVKLEVKQNPTVPPTISSAPVTQSTTRRYIHQQTSTAGTADNVSTTRTDSETQTSQRTSTEGNGNTDSTTNPSFTSSTKQTNGRINTEEPAATCNSGTDDSNSTVAIIVMCVVIALVIIIIVVAIVIVKTRRWKKTGKQRSAVFQNTGDEDEDTILEIVENDQYVSYKNIDAEYTKVIPRSQRNVHQDATSPTGTSGDTVVEYAVAIPKSKRKTKTEVIDEGTTVAAKHFEQDPTKEAGYNKEKVTHDSEKNEEYSTVVPKSQHLKEEKTQPDYV